MNQALEPRRTVTMSPIAAFILSTAMASVAATAVSFVLTSADRTGAPTPCECSCTTPNGAAAAVAAASPAPPAISTRVSDPPPVQEPPAAAAAEEPPNPQRSTRRTPRVRQAKMDASDGLDRDEIRRVVRAHISEIRHCYTRGLERDPDLEGRVVVQFVVESRGNVDEATVQSSSLDEAEVEQCIAGAVKRWRFPKPQGDENTVIAYPFVLSPG